MCIRDRPFSFYFTKYLFRVRFSTYLFKARFSHYLFKKLCSSTFCKAPFSQYLFQTTSNLCTLFHPTRQSMRSNSASVFPPRRRTTDRSASSPAVRIATTTRPISADTSSCHLLEAGTTSLPSQRKLRLYAPMAKQYRPQ